jgi:glycosyltransferase involved in cell wall biosynthesis
MRVAIDYTAAIYQSAGVGRFVRSLVKALAELDRENEYVLVYADPPRGVKPSFPGAPNFVPLRVPVPDRVLTILWHRLGLPVPIDLITGRVDVFHSPDFVLPPVMRAAKVLTVHDLAFLLHPECADAGLRNYLERTVPRSVARSDFILADSEHTKDDLICLLGVAPEKIEVVPGGVDPEFSPVEDAGRREEMRRTIGEGHPYILNLGVIEPRKNLVRLIEAFEMLKSRHDLPHRLVLAGKKGWLSDDIYRRAERSPLASEILFPGFVSEQDLPLLYAAADLFVFPSLYEGFGLPPLEAMASGVPVVVSRSSSLPEVVGDAALMVRPENAEELSEAMARVLTDDGLRTAMVARGLQQSRRFTWGAAAQRMLAAYRRLAPGA